MLLFLERPQEEEKEEEAVLEKAETQKPFACKRARGTHVCDEYDSRLNGFVLAKGLALFETIAMLKETKQ